ncbi:MAG: nucleotidyltransferase domain-containing protein [Silicimonas sp.]|nr:nucleotidyltransferase domain-containing protein [Silicimonas sp.]
MQPVSDAMRATIENRLAQIETEEGAQIILAVESGSRAWGFHSPDSDYDVRFIYKRPIEWHYRLGTKRDVIERPIDNELDLSGWELSKALTLTLGSNAVVAEWLQSPIVYRKDARSVDALQQFARAALERKSVTWHYVNLAQRQIDRLLDDQGHVRIKRYFYVLRPILALRWMRLADAPMPPMHMRALRDGAELDAVTSDALDMLTEQKMAAKEKGTVEAAPHSLQALVTSEMAQARQWLATAPKADASRLWETASRLHYDLSK